MNYEFPIIRHIDDVLPAIAGRDEFIVAERDGYKVVNYVVMMGDSFPTVDSVDAAIRRECRGMIFDSNGNLIARRYHKFFNANERDETRLENIDFSKPHVILEKLDGSMVSPVVVNGKIVWMTKMGSTDVSKEVEKYLEKNRMYDAFLEHFVQLPLGTLIFEWCSNKNRIILDYPEDQLVLTAIRNNYSGEYVSYSVMYEVAKHYGIPVVKAYSYDSKNILETVKNLEDTEGVVVRFDSGHMIKIKADWYVLRHKSKDAIIREKNIIEIIVNDQVDDILPYLMVDDQLKLLQFADKFREKVALVTHEMESLFNSISAVHDKRSFAINCHGVFDVVDEKFFRNCMFALYSGKDAKEVIYSHLRNNVSTQTKIDSVRWIFGGLKWEYSFTKDD